EPCGPFQAAFDDVAVLPEPGRGLDALASDPCGDVACSQQRTADRVVVALVTVQLQRSFPGTADRLTHRGEPVDHVLEHQMVVEVGGGDVHMQRQPAAIADRVDLGAGLAPVYRAGPGQVPLLTARTCMASMLARDQSICPAAPRTSSMAWCSAAITPWLTHSVNRRCALAREIGN